MKIREVAHPVQMQIYPRKLRTEFIDVSRENSGRVGSGYRNPERLPRPLSGQLFGYLMQIRKNAARIQRQGVTGFRKLKPSGSPDKQLHSQRLLEFLNMPADATLSCMQFMGGVRNVEMPCDDIKDAERIQRK